MPLTVEGHNVALDAFRPVASAPKVPATHAGLIEAMTVVTAIGNAANQFPTNSLSRTVKVGDHIAFYSGASRSSHRVTAVSGGNATISPATSFAVPVNSYVGHAPKIGADVLEPTGGSPAYARKPIIWQGATAEAINMDGSGSNKPLFDVNGGKAIAGFYIATAASGGSILGTFLTNSWESFGAQGTYQLTDARVTLTS